MPIRFRPRVSTFGYFAGILAPIWLAAGVFLVSLYYPDYSHVRQAMSELGAIGAPTHALSPVVNNFPLAALFIIFGCTVWRTFPKNWAACLSALLLVIHGVANIATGVWTCDINCGIDAPSSTQQVHNLAGLVMALSLLVANAIWIVLGKRLLGRTWLSGVSTLTTAICIGTLPLLASTAGTGGPFGLYQRINYGSSIIWVGVLAITLLANTRTQINADRPH
ncbi:hypothetical protein BW685_31165 [Burkholderia ubonensis]|uniref:DUF998 domain-containing protein n=2 Tax=Burkholderia ubonensis TaxID=101571 RepID=A0A1R1J279_9BURK|nr:hypothetical protein BW685_31165 [Burkholderia ubonensis]